MTSSSESAEPPGWLRLGDLAVGDGGVCVTSLIKDKIREYMLNGDGQQLQQASAQQASAQPAAAAAAAAGPSVRNGGADACAVRRIGNSLDALLRESRNAGHAVAAAAAVIKRKPRPPTDSSAPDDRCAASTTVRRAPADSSRRTDGLTPPPPPPTFHRRYLTVEDEMQISRMPIPVDDCKSTEMSVESNASDAKPVPENGTKVNGECHKNLNGSADDDVDDTKGGVDKASEGVVEEETVKEKEPEIKSEPLSERLDERVLPNGESELQEPEKNIDEVASEETKEEKLLAVDDTEVKAEPKNNEIDNDEATTPAEIVESETIGEPQQNESLVVVKEEPLGELEESVPKATEDVAAREKEALLSNGEVNQDNEVIQNNVVVETNPVNGEARPSEEDKNVKTEKVGQKVSVEEDVSSEISTDTLSPKQTDEPIARKRSAASHDDVSVVSGASSDNDLPKVKKLRSEDEAPVIKDDIRERLIKNIVQSCGKNEIELSKNIDKLQNEIKVITEIAQTKREELVTLIRLQKLKEEIIERLMIRAKEFDAAKTENSKDWNLPEMFQINLSQPELLLNEKNITEIIDNRETQFEKSAMGVYDQNSYTTSLSNMSVNSVALASNSQSSDWIMADRANRGVNRGQRIILPKPTIVNNGKEGRQGPTLDVKLLIADHRSKNPEAAVPKRGRRKAPVNEFSAPTSSGPLRYPNPMGFGNPMHHVNDGNFKTTITNSHGVPNNVMDHGSEHNRFKDAPAFPEVTLHPVSQTMQSQQQHQQQQQQTSLLHGILTKGAGTHHLPITMSNSPTNYSPTLARLLTAPERCKQSRGKQRQTTPAATVVSSNTPSRNEITITPVQSTSMSSSTFLQKPSMTSNIPPAQVDDEDASDRLVIDEGQDVLNANSPTSAPQCQGCLQKPAQFVCAGCGNQWYCSKDCQIDAWDEHSEVCSG